MTKEEYVEKIFALNIIKAKTFCNKYLEGKICYTWFSRKLNHQITGNAKNPAFFTDEELDMIIEGIEKLREDLALNNNL